MAAPRGSASGFSPLDWRPITVTNSRNRWRCIDLILRGGAGKQQYLILLENYYPGQVSNFSMRLILNLPNIRE